MPGGDVLLVVEVSETTLEFDLGTKAGLCAGHSLAEYRVVEAWTLVTHVHREPSPDGYKSLRKVQPHQRIVPKLVPELAVRLSELALE